MAEVQPGGRIGWLVFLIARYTRTPPAINASPIITRRVSSPTTLKMAKASPVNRTMATATLSEAI